MDALDEFDQYIKNNAVLIPTIEDDRSSGQDEYTSLYSSFKLDFEPSDVSIHYQAPSQQTVTLLARANSG